MPEVDRRRLEAMQQRLAAKVLKLSERGFHGTVELRFVHGQIVQVITHESEKWDNEEAGS